MNCFGCEKYKKERDIALQEKSELETAVKHWIAQAEAKQKGWEESNKLAEELATALEKANRDKEFLAAELSKPRDASLF